MFTVSHSGITHRTKKGEFAVEQQQRKMCTGLVNFTHAYTPEQQSVEQDSEAFHHTTRMPSAPSCQHPSVLFLQRASQAAQVAHRLWLRSVSQTPASLCCILPPLSDLHCIWQPLIFWFRVTEVSLL